MLSNHMGPSRANIGLPQARLASAMLFLVMWLLILAYVNNSPPTNQSFPTSETLGFQNGASFNS